MSQHYEVKLSLYQISRLGDAHRRRVRCILHAMIEKLPAECLAALDEATRPDWKWEIEIRSDE